MKALLIIDVQNDFCPGGALPTQAGDKIIPIINRLIPQFDLVIASKDWHPEETDHFDKWPVHCVRNTNGAAFHPALHQNSIDLIVLKGTGTDDDGYSVFEATNIDLESFLHEKGVTDLYLTGLATDYCVISSALAARKHDFNTFVIEDAVAGVEVEPGDVDRAWEEMKQAGVQVVQSEEIGGQ